MLSHGQNGIFRQKSVAYPSNVSLNCQYLDQKQLIMPITLDAIDRKILCLLQADGRISIADLAQKVGLSPSPCLRRVRLLEEAGIVARYVAVLDQQSVGLPVSVFVSIKLESQREEALDRFAKSIQRWPEVLECYLMTGPRDYLLRVVVADLAAYERFLKQKLTKLSGIGSIESSFALEQVKYTNVLPLA
jgi:Lrp/AsnC family transcriptional regulator, leucine-responsive regulatory protein